MHDVNIVIVNWKMKDDIDRCFRSLYDDNKDSGLNLVVHVIDNSNNADGVKEMLGAKYPTVIYHNPKANLGFGRGQNLGFKMAEARFYLPLNPDIEFLNGGQSLSRLVKYLESNPKVGIVGPKLLNPDATVQYSCGRFPRFFDQIARRLNLDRKSQYFKRRIDRYLMRDFDHERSVPVDLVFGSFMLVRKDLTEKIGWFDERYFMYFEDCDWCRRAWRAGYEIHYIHDVLVKHGHRRESADKNPWLAVIKNPVARMHVISWIKYFLKWGVGVEHYGI
jgi:GT2 family glycosyltransferase